MINGDGYIIVSLAVPMQQKLSLCTARSGHPSPCWDDTEGGTEAKGQASTVWHKWRQSVRQKSRYKSNIKHRRVSACLSSVAT